MPRLLAKEADSRRRPRSDAADLAAGPVDPARDIDRDDRQLALVQRCDTCTRYALDRARQTGAEDAVEDEAGAVECRRRQRFDHAPPTGGGLGCVAAQRRNRAEQSDA